MLMYNRSLQKQNFSFGGVVQHYECRKPVLSHNGKSGIPAQYLLPDL